MKSMIVIMIASMYSLAFSQYQLEWQSPDGLNFGELLDFGTAFPLTTIADFNEDGIQELIVVDEGDDDGDSLGNMYVYDMITYDLLYQNQIINDAYFFGFANITDEPTKEFIIVSGMNTDPYEGETLPPLPNPIVYVFNTVTNESTIIANVEGWGMLFLSIWTCNCGDEIKDKVVFTVGDHIEVWGDGSGLSAISSTNLPALFKLNQNYPNPFNPITTIEYEMPKNGNVNVSIYNIKGELVEKLIDGYNTTGKYSIQWNPKNISSGQYFYQISVDDFVQTKKMVLLK